MTIRACASLPYGCNQKGQGSSVEGAPSVLKFVPCGKCSAIMPCAKEFICDTFKTWIIQQQGNTTPLSFNWCNSPSSNCNNGFCTKLDFDGNELQLSTEFDADGNPDPTFPQHVYRVKFDSDYIRNISDCGDGDSDPCEGTRTTSVQCDFSSGASGSNANKQDKYTLKMTRSHAVFGYELDEDGNPTTTPIVC